MRYEHAHRPALAFSLMVVSLAVPAAVRASTFQCGQCHGLAAELREEVIRPFDRTITITGTPTLRVEHRNGDVRVRSHARNELRIQATIHVSATSRNEAEDFAARVQIDVREALGSITVRTLYPSSRRDLSYSVDYDLLVPERMPLDVRNNFGDVSVTGLKADGAVFNANGRLSVRDGSGRYRLENSFGPIEAMRLDGDVTINGANGSVSATSVNGAVNVTNRFGPVTAATIRGDAFVTNSNGKIEASAITGKVDLRTTFGSTEFRDVGSVSVTSSNGAVTGVNIDGSAIVKASFGPVNLRNVSRDARVDNSNGAVILEDVRGGADLSTQFARVEARAVKGGLRVTASNGHVRAVDVDGAVSLKTSFAGVEADRIRGPLTVDNANGGVQAAAIGGAASVTSSFGSVVLKDVDGRVDVRNRNGAVEVWPFVKPGTCHDIALMTSFSPMQVHVPDSGYTVAARTTFGTIQAEMPITATGTISGNAISGTIGRGGCNLQLTNNNGNIQILRAVANR